MATKAKKKKPLTLNQLLRKHLEQAKRSVGGLDEWEISKKPFGPLPAWLRTTK